MSKHHFTVIVYFQNVFYYPDLILQPWSWCGAGYVPSDPWEAAARGAAFLLLLTPANQGTPPKRWGSPHRPGIFCGWTLSHMHRTKVMLWKNTNNESQVRKISWDELVVVITEMRTFFSTRMTFLGGVPAQLENISHPEGLSSLLLQQWSRRAHGVAGRCPAAEPAPIPQCPCPFRLWGWKQAKPNRRGGERLEVILTYKSFQNVGGKPG